MIGSTELVDNLRDDGWDVSHGYVMSLIRERHLPAPPKGPGGAFVWQEADIDRLESILRRRDRGPVEALVGQGGGSCLST